MLEEQLVSPSKRKKKQGDEISIADSDTTEWSSKFEDDDSETSTAATSVVEDDGLPHPRVCHPTQPNPTSYVVDKQRSLKHRANEQTHQPFESRREFFARTSNEWQEILMTSLRWKGIQPEGMLVKEIKTKAFEMSEEKWWDCREEITALEDEQEAAGIGEVVSLADKGSGAATGGAGRRR